MEQMKRPSAKERRVIQLPLVAPKVHATAHAQYEAPAFIASLFLPAVEDYEELPRLTDSWGSVFEAPLAAAPLP